MATTGNQLIKKVLRRLLWPADISTGLSHSTNPLTDAELLEIADEVLVGSYWPDLIKTDGAFYKSHADYSITSGQARYRLPNRHFGPVLDILLVDDSGDEISLPYVTQEELGHLRNSPIGGVSRYWHYLDGDFVGLFPEPTVTQDTLRVKYYRAPNALCLESAALQITSVSVVPPDYDLVFASDPDTLWNAGDQLDVISNGNTHQIVSAENEIDNFPIGPTLEARMITAFTAAEVLAGDWAATTGTTPIVQLPDHLIPAFVRRVAEEVALTQRDMTAAQAERESARVLDEKAAKLTSPRSEAEPRTTVCRNSPFRLGQGYRR